VAVPDAVIERLRQVCRDVDTSLQARVEASRDWWPLAVTWALQGEVPAVAAVVARPRDPTEVAAVLAVCHDAAVPVTPAGGGSGVGGHAVPVFGGVVIDVTGLSGIVRVDDESLVVDVAAGTFGDWLEDALRAEHGVTLGHWPQSMALSTVGGWVACRGAGQFSTRYGKIEDMVTGLQVALADGRVVTTGGRAPRSATGPDLTQLFVGSEGTLGVITEVQLRVHPLPPAQRRAAFGFATFAGGLDACRRILRRGATPAVVRLYDALESQGSFGVPGGNVLIVLDEGEPGIIDAVMSVVAEECSSAEAEELDASVVDQWLHRRLDTSALERAVRGGLTVDTIEVAARWGQLAALYSDVVEALRAAEGTVVASAHQSHAYPDGACLYFTFAGHLDNADAADDYYRRVWDLVMHITEVHGGVISHHHGVGLNRGRHLPAALGPAFDVLVSLKQTLDPRGVLNPGKLGLPSPFGEAPWP
jgi:alkyldihydroxyacetonephosphate synthase